MRRLTLDEVALGVGVGVAVLIVTASYAVSATSVYDLLRQYGYARWQSLAGPLVADGPALYGMVRVVARARRGAGGAWYGWALVGAGTACSIAGNVTHALTLRPGSWVAGGIAALIPLAVLAMLEAIRGDAREVYRAVHREVRHHVRSAKQPASLPASPDAASVGQTPASPEARDAAAVTQPGEADEAAGDAATRVAAALAGPAPAGGWTGPKLADAAQVPRSTADRHLRKHRLTAARRPDRIPALNGAGPHRGGG
jgi:hypothetical protein